MPQNGFHGLVGLAVARWLVPRAPRGAGTAFAAGIVLGAMLPDIDIYPTAVAYLLGRDDLTYILHRTATHGLLAILVVAALGAVLARRFPPAAWACWGAALGIATHALLDTFFWFEQLDFFWPLSHLPSERPLLPVINVWGSTQPLPALFGKETFLRDLREACELAAFALYLRALRGVIGRGSVGASIPKLHRSEAWAWAGFVVMLAGAFVLPRLVVVVLVYALWLAVFAPLCWVHTLRSRRALAVWCREARRDDAARR